MHFSKACTNRAQYFSVFKMKPQWFSSVCYKLTSIISSQITQKLLTVMISQVNLIKKYGICFQYSNTQSLALNMRILFFFFLI